MKFLNLFLLFVSAALIFSCQKKQDDEFASVTFRMPVLSRVSSVHAKYASAPTTIDEVNCYAIMVTGPEPFLNRTYCPVVNSTGSQIANVAPKRAGIIRGLIPENGLITLPVPAGIQRRFTLLGVKADPITACIDFNSPFASSDFISELFVMGESASVDLQPGAEVAVPIQIAATGTPVGTDDPRLGECVGPDSPTNRGKVYPTRAIVTKNFFPYEQLIEGTCNAVDINFVDDIGRFGLNQNNSTMEIEKINLDSNGNEIGSFTPFTNFSEFSNCSPTSGSSFTISAFTPSKKLFISTEASSTVSGYKFRLRKGTSNYQDLVSSPPLMIKPNNHASVEIIGPRRVVSNMCYNMVGIFKKLYNFNVNGVSVAANYPDTLSKAFLGNGCSGVELGSTSQSITEANEFNFSTRFTHDFFANTFFSLTPTVSPTYTAEPAKYRIQVVGGSHNPVFLRPEIKQPVSSSPGCYGPFSVFVENERGGALVTSGNINLTIGNGLSLHSNDLCNQSYLSSFTNDYRKQFFIGSSGISGVVSFMASGQINHPDFPGSTPVSLTTTINVNFQ